MVGRPRAPARDRPGAPALAGDDGRREALLVRRRVLAVLLDPEGRMLLHHRKLNELEIGHTCYDQGDRLGVVQTSVGTMGLMICADAFARGPDRDRVDGCAPEE